MSLPSDFYWLARLISVVGCDLLASVTMSSSRSAHAGCTSCTLINNNDLQMHFELIELIN